MIKPGRIICLLYVIFLMSCATQEPFYNASVSDWQEARPATSSDLIYEVYLVGDSRRAFENEALMKMMDSHLSLTGELGRVLVGLWRLRRRLLSRGFSVAESPRNEDSC